MRAVATTRSTHRRRLGAVASLALVSVLAVGCGDDSDGDNGNDSGESASTLSQDQLNQAVIPVEVLGTEWTEEPEDDEDDSSALGCLSEIDQVTEDIEPESEIEKTYAEGEIGLPQVQSAVATFEDEQEFAEAFDAVQAAMTECTNAEGTDEEGTVYDLAVTTDETAAEGVDDQLNLVASGSITAADGQELGLSVHMTMARVANHVTLVATTDLGDETELHGALTDIGIDRLIAVIAGEEPAETTAPEPA